MASPDAAQRSRPDDLRRARLLSGASVAWSGVTGGVAIVLAVVTGSVSLLGFGLDAAIDSIASIALIRRFAIEERDPARAEWVEHRAERIMGFVLVAAAAILVAGAVRAVLLAAPVEASAGPLALVAASLVVLPPLAIAKRRVADRLGSRALRADSLLTGAAAILAALTIVSLALTMVAGLWWSDPAAAILIAVVLAREGVASAGLSRSAG